MSQSKDRLLWLDTLRGGCVVLMILYHALYDLVSLDVIPYALFKAPVVSAVHWCFAVSFVLISGFSCTLSRSNTKRGLRLLAAALLLSAATALLERLALRLFDLEFSCFIVFGVLHMLSVSMLLYALLGSVLKLRSIGTGALLCAAALLTAGLALGVRTEAKWLFPLGFISENFRSADFFPLLPWSFVFFLGAWLGTQYGMGRLNIRSPKLRLKLLPWLGRHSLAVYLIHQPVVMAVCFGISALLHIL